MAKFVCRCLNVTLNCIATGFEPMDNRDLGLPTTSLTDPFFNNKMTEVKLDSRGVSLAQATLLTTRQCGKLTISSCFCCKQDTHAVLGNNEMTLINLALQSDQNRIKNLTESQNFSHLFKIILPIVPDAPQHTFYELKQQSKNCQLDTVVQAIRQQSTNFLCEQQKEMDERIRLFTEQQYAEYKILQKQILDERQTLINLLFQAQSSKDGITQTRLPVSLASFPSPPTSPDYCENTPSSEYSFERVENTKELVPKTMVKVSTSQVTARQSSSLRSTIRSASVSYSKTHDNSTMFDMDGLEEDTGPFSLSDDEADTDDSTADDLVRLRQSNEQLQRQAYATSLPITVPLWSSINRAELSDDSDKSSNPDPQQIAASIQALALSIRDDKEMFGDLPRRRLNTGDLVKSRPI